MAEERWQDVGPAEELRARAVTPVRAGSTPVALVYKDGAWSAISGVCNHVGGPLGDRDASEEQRSQGGRCFE